MLFVTVEPCIMCAYALNIISIFILLRDKISILWM